MEITVTKEEYESALKKMKNSRSDVVGKIGTLGITGIGVTAGIGASGPIAATFGATTLMGSTTLASIFSGILVTTTPIGWVVGSAIAAGSLAYGTGLLIRSGERCDNIKKKTIKEIKQRMSVNR
jgi:hypothetical protein